MPPEIQNVLMFLYTDTGIRSIEQIYRKYGDNCWVVENLNTIKLICTCIQTSIEYKRKVKVLQWIQNLFRKNKQCCSVQRKVFRPNLYKAKAGVLSFWVGPKEKIPQFAFNKTPKPFCSTACVDNLIFRLNAATLKSSVYTVPVESLTLCQWWRIVSLADWVTVKLPVTIGTTLNFDGDGVGMCKQTFILALISKISSIFFWNTKVGIFVQRIKVSVTDINFISILKF